MKRGLLILFFVLLIINVNAAIKTDASIITISNENGNIIKLDNSNGIYNYTLLKTTAFGDWIDSTLVDIDGDGNNELVGLRDIGKMDVYIYEYKDDELVEKASPLDISNFPANMEWISITASDIDNNKKDELILGPKKLGRFYSIGYQGSSYITTVMGETRLKSWDAFDVGDIDGDKIKELVTIRQSDLGKSIYVYKIIDGKLGQEMNYGEFSKISFISLKITDIDNDGANEIISLDKDGKFYISKIKNGVYSQNLLADTSFSDWLDMDVGDIDKDSKNEIVALARQEKPFYVFEYNENTRVVSPSVIRDYTPYLKWSSISVGKFISENIKPEVVVPENKTIEEIPEEIPQIENKTEEPQQEIKPEVKESNHSVLYILLIIVILFLFLLTTIILTTKYEFKIFDKFKKKESQELPKIEKQEIQEDIWPETRKSKDLKDMKDFIKKGKNSNK
ncbi:MAG: VCBS repeat-containing protein [Candidatus Nanoarchaeia archaeon]|nr:VCBS repeat-containing protein [Candidatus Nanoarchaeia archaeon]MDD5587760.1 VCBS repeat-containing protein [Candidatus Nanoarchaeia archaeon]